jgi:hypothetical protein
MPEHLDDGVASTHFSYVFEPDEAMKRFRLGLLPEMHCWAAILGDDPAIVDLTTRFVVQNATEAGITWLAAHPPRYVWATSDTLPAESVYKPHPIAIAIALQAAKNLGIALSA